MSKTNTTTTDAFLDAMRHNTNCGYHLEQVDTTPYPSKPSRKPGLDYYDRVGGRKFTRKAFVMELHGRQRG